MRTMAIVGAFAAMLGAAGTAPAQDTVLTLSLDEAIELARRNNPAYQQVLNDVEVAHNAERAGWAQYLPSLSVSTGLSGSYSRSVTGTGDFGELIRRDDPLVSRSSGMSQSVGIGLPVIFDGGARRNRLRAARAQTVASEALVDARDLTLRADVERAYVSLQAAQATARLEERLLASQEERLALTEQMYRMASKTRIDLLGAREQVASRESNLAAARASADKGRLALLTQLGVDQALSVQLTDTLLVLFDPGTLDDDELVAVALARHPALRQAEASRTVSASNLQAAKGARWPRISPSISYSRSIGRRNYDAWTDIQMPENQSVGFGIGISYDVFDRWSRSNSIASAEADLEDREFALRQERQVVEQNVRTALIDLENAYRTLELARLGAGISAERLELSMEEYRLGSIPYDRLQTIIDGAANAERAELNARVQFAQALIVLEQRVGQRVRP